MTEQKRKYRRHPKPDENAPEKPPSAYVLFSNKVREEVKSENLSFTEIARLVGERWQKLNPAEKESFESHASALKETYNAQLSEYKKTDVYKEYSQYLADFKAKHSNTNNETKRPKLESSQSSGGASIPSPGMIDGVAPSSNHARGISVGSSNTISYSGQGTTVAASQAHGVSGLPHLNGPMGRRTSPSYYSPQDIRRPGHLSSHSSVSEESSSTRADHSDTLSRTASLSLTIEPPPLTIPAHRAGWGEYAPTSGYASTPARRGPPTYSPSATSGTSPTSTTTSVPASVSNGDWWRDKGPEPSRLPINGSTAASLIAISSLVAPKQGEDAADKASRRALPPLRQLPNTASQASYGGLGGKPGSGQGHYSSVELTPIRERPLHELPTQSENEAADVLAGLSERQSNMQSPWTPRSRPDEP